MGKRSQSKQRWPKRGGEFGRGARRPPVTVVEPEHPEENLPLQRTRLRTNLAALEVMALSMAGPGLTVLPRRGGRGR